MPYYLWSAIAYEITSILIDIDARWANNKIVIIIRKQCFPDWVQWKTEQTMKSVDKQINSLQTEMKIEDDKKYVKPIIIEHPSDGSRSQDLLGGELEIKAPWYNKQ